MRKLSQLIQQFNELEKKQIKLKKIQDRKRDEKFSFFIFQGILLKNSDYNKKIKISVAINKKTCYNKQDIKRWR